MYLILVWGSTNKHEGYSGGDRNDGSDDGIADKRERMVDSWIECSSACTVFFTEEDQVGGCGIGVVIVAVMITILGLALEVVDVVGHTERDLDQHQDWHRDPDRNWVIDIIRTRVIGVVL